MFNCLYFVILICKTYILRLWKSTVIRFKFEFDVTYRINAVIVTLRINCAFLMIYFLSIFIYAIIPTTLLFYNWFLIANFVEFYKKKFNQKVF